MLLASIDFNGESREQDTLAPQFKIVEITFKHCTTITIINKKYKEGEYNRGCLDDPNEYEIMVKEISAIIEHDTLNYFKVPHKNYFGK